MNDPRPQKARPGQKPDGVGEHDELTLRVLRAQAGDAESLNWLIVRLSPLLRSQAQYRLRALTVVEADPDDLVDETWLVVLARIGDLRGEPHTRGRALLGFLSKTLHNKALSLHARGNRRERSGTHGGQRSSVLAPVDGLQSPSGPPSATLRGLEEGEELHRALASLDPRDREIILLRALEQRSNDAVARELGLTPAGATRRFQRALVRLRQRMPSSLFDELAPQ